MDAASDEVFDWFREELLPIGDWLSRNGEAIFGTRPWYDGVPQSVTAEGTQVRYTVKDDSLYLLLFGAIGDRATFPRLKAQPDTRVQALEPDESVEWEQTGGGLVLHMLPADPDPESPGPLSGKYVRAFKITPRPVRGQP